MTNKKLFHKFIILFSMIIAAAVFIRLYSLVASGGSLSFDESLLVALSKIRSTPLNIVVLGITHTATYVVVIPIVAIIVYLYRRGEKVLAVVPMLSFAVFISLGLLLKSLVGRPRPSIVLPVMIEPLFSFPSGHTMMAAGVYGLISLILWQRQRKILSLVSAVWVVLIALSRVYLGVHYPSDVLASLLLGYVLLGIIFWIDHSFITGRILQNTQITGVRDS